MSPIDLNPVCLVPDCRSVHSNCGYSKLHAHLQERLAPPLLGVPFVVWITYLMKRSSPLNVASLFS